MTASTTSATSPSSPTSTTASRRWPTASCRSPTRWPSARCASRCSTAWTWSGSGASPSRPRPCASTTRRTTARSTSSTSSTLRGTSTSPTRCRAAWPRARAPSWWSTPPRASRRRRSPTRYLALENDLEIIPVLNKIDLPGAEPEKRADEIVNLIGCDPTTILHISAKTGEGVPAVLEAIVHRIPPPQGEAGRPASGAHLRLGLRPVPGRGGVRAGARRDLPQERRPARLGDPAQERGRRGGHLQPRHAEDRRAARRRGGLHHPGHQGGGRPARGRHPDHADRPATEALPGYREITAHGLLRALPHRRRRLPRPPGRPGEAQAQRRLPVLRARDLQGPRASASGAAFWVCCTWRSSASGWSASSAWTCWRRRPTCATRSR